MAEWHSDLGMLHWLFNKEGQDMQDSKSLRLSWRSDGNEWSETQLQESAKQAVSLSDMHLAIDISKTAIEKFGLAPTSQYYQALAYANCGSREEVFKLMEQLMATVKEGDAVYTDTLSLLGRLEKDRYLRAPEGDAKDAALANALNAYHDAYKITDGSFPGINAATLYLLAGGTAQAREIAAALITSNASDQDEFWQLATLAEAHVLLEEYDTARHYYEKVVSGAGENFGQIASVKKHLPLIDQVQSVPKDILAMLDGPAIAIFSGHMFDTADRAEPRFPLSLKDAAAEAIGAYIDEANIKIAYSSAACGGDLLFCREILNRNLELNIVLPFAAEDFRRSSVAINGVDESMEFWDILKHANSVTIATDESHLNNPCLFTHAANLIEGYASLRATQCDGRVEVIAAIDPYMAGEPGGTLERTIDWLEQGIDVHVIDVAMLRGDEAKQSVIPQVVEKPDTRHLGREIMSLVEITTNVPLEEFAKGMEDKLLNDAEFLRGEGINRAFHSVKDAADYAYHIRAIAPLVNWLELASVDELQIQIAIHTGPIFPRSRTKGRDYFGTHVFYARELADMTPPGCIYLTEPAAALLLTHGPKEYVSDYLGAMQVKDFTRQIYRLHRA